MTQDSTVIIFSAALGGAIVGSIATALIAYRIISSYATKEIYKVDEKMRINKRAFRPKRLIFIRHGESLGNTDNRKYGCVMLFSAPALNMFACTVKYLTIKCH